MKTIYAKWSCKSKNKRYISKWVSWRSFKWNSLDLNWKFELSWALEEKSDYVEDNLFLFSTCIRWKSITIESKVEIVGFYLLGKLSNKFISYLIKLEVDQVKWVIKHFQQACKNRLQINRTETARGRQKFKAEHIDWLKTYLESKRNSRVVPFYQFNTATLIINI